MAIIGSCKNCKWEKNCKKDTTIKPCCYYKFAKRGKENGKIKR